MKTIYVFVLLISVLSACGGVGFQEQIDQLSTHIYEIEIRKPSSSSSVKKEGMVLDDAVFEIIKKAHWNTSAPKSLIHEELYFRAKDKSQISIEFRKKDREVIIIFQSGKQKYYGVVKIIDYQKIIDILNPTGTGLNP